MNEEKTEGKYGDFYKKVFDFEKPKTEDGYNNLYDKVDAITEKAIEDIAKRFGIQIEDIEEYSLVKDVASLILEKIREHFDVETIMENPENN